MRRNYQTDDICTSMRKQMAVMWELCEKYPSMDFYRMSGTRRSGCRITIMVSDMAEVWTEELARKKSIEPDFAGSVISNYVTAEDKARAIPVAERDYSALKNKEFGRFAYQSTWGYKWIQFARTYDDLYKIIEHVVLVYAKETESDLYVKRDAYEKDNYRNVVEDYLKYENSAKGQGFSHLHNNGFDQKAEITKITVKSTSGYGPIDFSIKTH